MEGNLFVLIALVIGLASLVLWVWALVDAVRRPTSEWDAAAQNQLLWVVVIVVTGAIGALIYLFVARPQLQRARERV